jgi:hypothetical protein
MHLNLKPEMLTASLSRFNRCHLDASKLIHLCSDRFISFHLLSPRLPEIRVVIIFHPSKILHPNHADFQSIKSLTLLHP